MEQARRHGRRRAGAASGYGAALGAGVDATTRGVEEMHRAIARVPFRVLQVIPGVSFVARLVERSCGAITGLVYAAVRWGSAAGIAVATRAVVSDDAPDPSATARGRVEGVVRSALNGSHGDFLAATANPLAVGMAFRVGGRSLPLTPGGLRAALPHATGRVCVFVHGICMDESAWRWGAGPAETACTYGDRLEEALGYTPLYLRYNTGLPIADNGRELAERLQALVDAYPCDVREVVLVGHSMGGLVVHYACAAAANRRLAWAGRTRMVITLGSPFGGAPLAKAGHLATAALKRIRVTAPLGALADARSAGVKDLRHDHAGGPAPGRAPGGAPVAYRHVSGSLRARRGGPLARVLGDGLVPAESAAPADAVRGGTAHVDGVGHLRLLNEPRVYAQIERWLAEAGL
jgi:pimeloyl-ACP methyl ester carboxylesterase